MYFAWKCVKLTRDVKDLWLVKRFYQRTLNIDEFELRTIRWTEIVQRIITSSHGLNSIDQSDAKNLIATGIVVKENWFKRLLDVGLVDCVFRFERWNMKTEFCMLTKGLQWNIM